MSGDFPGLHRRPGTPLDYTDLHWGTQSRFVEDLRYHSNEPAERDGEIRAISYVTVKDGEPGVYEHVFEAPDGKRPQLLRIAKSGKARTIATREREPIALGRVIDIRMMDGRVIVPTLLWIVCEREPAYQGSPVILAGRFDVPLAIEHRVWDGRLLPYVVEHGIVG